MKTIEPNLNNHAGQIVFKGISTATARDSPKCMLRIPEKIQPDLLQVPTLQLPAIHKAQSASNSPYQLPPKGNKEKNYEFPDAPEKSQSPKDKNGKCIDLPIINAKVIRNMRKHSSDKRIKVQQNDLPSINKSPMRKSIEGQLNSEGVFNFDNW